MQDFLLTPYSNALLISSDQLPAAKGTYRVKGIYKSTESIYQYFTENSQVTNTVNWVKAPFESEDVLQTVPESDRIKPYTVYVSGALLVKEEKFFLPRYSPDEPGFHNSIDLSVLFERISTAYKNGAIVLDTLYFDDSTQLCEASKVMSLLNRFCKKFSNLSILISSPQNTTASYFCNYRSTRLADCLINVLQSTQKDKKLLYAGDWFSSVQNILKTDTTYAEPIVQIGNNIALSKALIPNVHDGENSISIAVENPEIKIAENKNLPTVQPIYQDHSLTEKALNAYQTESIYALPTNKTNEYDSEALASTVRQEVYDELDETLWLKILKWNVPSAYIFYLESFENGKYVHRAEALLKDNLKWEEHDLLQQEKQQLNEAVKLFLIEKDKDEKKRIAFLEKVRETYQRLDQEKSVIVNELKDRKKGIEENEIQVKEQKEYLASFDSQLKEKEITLKQTEQALSEIENTLLEQEKQLAAQEVSLSQAQTSLEKEKAEVKEEMQQLAEKSVKEKEIIKEMHKSIISEKEKIVGERERIIKTFNNQKTKFLADKEAFYKEKTIGEEKIALAKNKIQESSHVLEKAKENWVAEQAAIENEIALLSEQAHILTEEKQTFKKEQNELEKAKEVFEAQKAKETIKLDKEKKLLQQQYENKNDAFNLVKQNWEKQIKQTQLKDRKAKEAFEKNRQEREAALIQSQKDWERERKEKQEKDKAKLNSKLNEIKQKEEVLQLNKNQLLADQKQFDEQLTNWETEKQRTHQQLSFLQNTLEDEKKKVEENLKIIQNLHKQEGKLKKSIEAANNKIKALETDLMALEQTTKTKNAELINKKSELENELTESKKVVDLLNTDQETFVKKIRELENKLMLANERVKNKTSDLNSLKKEKLQLANDSNKLKDQSIEKEKELTAQNSKLEAELISLKSLVEQEKILMQHVEEEKRVAFEKQLEELSANHQRELKSITNRLERENKSLLRKSKTEINTLQKTLKTTNTDLQDVKMELEIAKRKAAEYENDHIESIASQKEMLAEVISLKARLSSIEQQSEKKVIKPVLEIQDEETLWAKTVTLGTEEAFNYYLDNTLEGRYKNEANVHLATLKNISELAQKLAKPIGVNKEVTNETTTDVAVQVKESDIVQTEMPPNEEQLWRDTQKEDTINAYRHYLHHSKDQKYTEVVLKRIEELQEKQIEKEEALWAKASKGDSEELLNTYLEQFPAGKYASQVLFKLDELKKK